MQRDKTLETLSNLQKQRREINALISTFYFFTASPGVGIYYHATTSAKPLEPLGEIREKTLSGVKTLFKGNYPEIIFFLENYLTDRGIPPAINN